MEPFSCVPKPNDFIKQRCYDNYTSTLSPLLTPLDFAGITFGILAFSWLVVALLGAMILKRIKEEDSGEMRQNGSKKLMKTFTGHVCFQLVFLSIMMGLFGGYQTLSYPVEYKCYLSNTTVTAFNQMAVNITCSDLRYKANTNLNVAIIVFMGISTGFCLLTVLHLIAKRKEILGLLIGDTVVAVQDVSLNERPADSDNSQAAVEKAVRALKASIKTQTTFQPKLFPDICNMETDDIFTNLLIQDGREPLENEKVAGRREHHGQVSGIRVKHCREIFLPAKDGEENPKSILLTGKAGIGKTFFCQKLIRDWADDGLLQSPTNSPMPHFQFTYLLTFRQLNLFGDKPITLKELLNCSSMLDDQSIIDESLLEYIRSHSEEVLIIIDGFDEYCRQDDIAGKEFSYSEEKMPVAGLCAKLMRGQILGRATVMITSRPDESEKISGHHFDRNVEITGFSEQEVKEYIEKYFRGKEPIKNAVLDHITKNKDLVSLAHIPVLCAFMCFYMEYILQESKRNTNLPVSMSDLYYRVLQTFEQKHSRKKLKAERPTLDKFAAELLLKKRYVFDEKEMRNLNQQDVESLRSSGLLHCGPPFRLPDFQVTKNFCFIHLTLHEFLAARWFVKTGTIPQEGTVSTMVLQFMASMLSKEKDTELMKTLLERLPTSVGTNEHLLKARCFYEYQDKEFAKDHYRQHPVHDRTIEFCDVNYVDCSAISFFLDIISALNREETTPTNQELSKQQFMVKGLVIHASNLLTLSGVERICNSLEEDSSTVTELALSRCHVDDKCVGYICRVVSSKLTNLDLCNNHVTDAGVASLREALKQTGCKVSTLCLTKNEITDAGVDSLCDALKHPSSKVTTLNLSFNEVTDVGATALSEALEHPNCKVTELDLGFNKLTVNGVGSLSDVLPRPGCKVTELSLFGNHITDASIVRLSKSLAHKSCLVTELDLGNNKITHEGVSRLCEAIKQKSCKVTTLRLGGNKINADGVASLTEVLKQASCKVTMLGLDDNQITDADVARLCEALKHPSCKITALDLANNEITDSGVVSLCEALKHPSCKVTALFLDKNQIKDGGVANLCKAIKHSSCKVTAMGLAYNKFTDNGVSKLCEAIIDLNEPRCKVTNLCLFGNSISKELEDSVKHRLQTHRPDVGFYF